MLDICTPAMRWIASVMFSAGNLPMSSDEMPSEMRMSLRLVSSADLMLERKPVTVMPGASRPSHPPPSHLREATQAPLLRLAPALA
jgi:hypothetical protein